MSLQQVLIETAFVTRLPDESGLPSQRLWIWTSSFLPFLQVEEKTSTTLSIHLPLIHPFMQHVLSSYYVPGIVRDISDVMETWWDVLLIYLFASMLNKCYRTRNLLLPRGHPGPSQPYLVLHQLYSCIIPPLFPLLLDVIERYFYISCLILVCALSALLPKGILRSQWNSVDEVTWRIGEDLQPPALCECYWLSKSVLTAGRVGHIYHICIISPH